jgi:hypothetical protein
MPKSKQSARESEWRKWDLQAHTPASHLNNQFGGGWDAYVQGLFRAAIAKDIEALGITDYFTIDGYKKIRTEYIDDQAKMRALFASAEIDKIAEILIVPNVEFRLDRIVGKSRLNCHLLFSDELSIRDIEENLHDLNFTDQTQPQATAQKRKLKAENLRELGERLRLEHQPFQNQAPLFVGMENAVVNDDSILQALSDSRFTMSRGRIRGSCWKPGLLRQGRLGGSAEKVADGSQAKAAKLQCGYPESLLGRHRPHVGVEVEFFRYSLKLR